jgi:hypothetical protein
MDLPGGFCEADRGVQMLADGILVERFDARRRQLLAAEIIERVFQQLSADPLVAKTFVDGEIRNEADAGLAVDPRADEPGDVAVDHRHEDSGRIAADIVIQMPALPPLPVMRPDRSQSPLDVLIDRHSFEAVDENRPQRFGVGGLERADGEHQILQSKRVRQQSVDQPKISVRLVVVAVNETESQDMMVRETLR